MNYEDLLNGVQPALKAIKDGAAAVTKHQKPLGKNLESGNLAEIRKEIAILKEQTNQLQARVQEAESLVKASTSRSTLSAEISRGRCWTAARRRRLM